MFFLWVRYCSWGASLLEMWNTSGCSTAERTSRRIVKHQDLIHNGEHTYTRFGVPSLGGSARGASTISGPKLYSIASSGRSYYQPHAPNDPTRNHCRGRHVWGLVVSVQRLAAVMYPTTSILYNPTSAPLYDRKHIVF